MEGAIQQLVVMALSENEIVVEQACKSIGEFRLLSATEHVSCECFSFVHPLPCVKCTSGTLRRCTLLDEILPS